MCKLIALIFWYLMKENARKTLFYNDDDDDKS